MTPQRLARLVSVAAIAILALAIPAPVFAALISVDTVNDDNGTLDAAHCSLREAIMSANSGSAVGGCSAGTGTDTIDVPAGTYFLNPGPGFGALHIGNGSTALDISIDGAGAGLTTISPLFPCVGGVVAPLGTEVFSLFDVTATAVQHQRPDYRGWQCDHLRLRRRDLWFGRRRLARADKCVDERQLRPGGIGRRALRPWRHPEHRGKLILKQHRWRWGSSRVRRRFLSHGSNEISSPPSRRTQPVAMAAPFGSASTSPDRNH